MQKSLMKLLGVAVLTLSSQVSAVGLGGINVSSSLGQPLKANIDLVAVSEAEKTGLTARLATPEAYKSAGLEYPAGITFKFEIDENTRAITVLSNQSINSPFVSLLIELSWASGKLLRDYTFLIDPPGYTPEPAPLPVVQPIAPSVSAVPAVSTVPVAPIVSAEVDSHPILETPPQAIAQPVSAVKVVKTSAETVKIQRGDTIAKVAAQNKPAEISLDRMMVALYRANTQKFVGSNMNRVKTGTILRLPNQQELANVSANDARKEIHAQAKDWNSYRQQLASNTASSQPDSAQQSSTGKISSSVTDKTPVSSAKEVLKLSSGNAPTDKVATAQDKQNAAQEDAIAKAKAVKEEQARAALAAKNTQDAQHLLELKSQAGMLASSVAATASGVSMTHEVASAPIVLTNPASAIGAAISAIKPAAHSSVPHPVKPIAKPSQPETSWVDKALATVAPVLDEPIYLAGGAALLLGLGGLVYVLSRRQSQPKQSKDEAEANMLSAAFANEEDEAETDEEEAEDVGAATARFYQTQNAASYQPVVHEEVEEDPIEEARLFLSFGRDAQAEDILKDALKKTPNNYQLHLELLGIYAHRKDVNAFSAIAQQVKTADDDVLWAQAAALGRKIDPSNSLYADSDVPVVTPPAFVKPEPAHSLDFDLGIATSERSIPNLNVPAPQLRQPDSALPNSIDLHVGTAEHLAMSPELIFDVSAKPKAVSDAQPSMDEMMFDVTSAHPSLAAAPVAAPVAAKDEPMTFNMDFMLSGMKTATPPVAQAAPAAPADKSDMPFTVDFAMPDLPAAPVAKAPIEIDTMPFTIDFAMPEATATPKIDHAPVMMEFSMSDAPPVTSNPPAVKLDFGGIDLEMGSASSASGNIESAASQEIDNKLDLAKIYMEMDDPASAREFLAEVLREGNPEQIGRAQAMLKTMG